MKPQLLSTTIDRTVVLCDGDSKMTLTFTGSDCAVSDFSLAVQAFARQWRTTYAQTHPTKRKDQPCGCGEKQ